MHPIFFTSLRQTTHFPNLIGPITMATSSNTNATVLPQARDEDEFWDMCVDEPVCDCGNDVGGHELGSVGCTNDHECAICQEMCRPGGHCAFQFKRCGHIFGLDCIEQLVNGNTASRNRCPLCRDELFVISAEELEEAELGRLADEEEDARMEDYYNRLGTERIDHVDVAIRTGRWTARGIGAQPGGDREISIVSDVDYEQGGGSQNVHGGGTARRHRTLRDIVREIGGRARSVRRNNDEENMELEYIDALNIIQHLHQELEEALGFD